ncbi:MaoC family dehydratase [Amycolatopsis sp. NPDC049868]|uniref:MaoC family dehydratase n=1 Tax=Amycolatopsis sp. NPDC049868 TaxID=3363934 RepID=UPI0037945C75
MRIFTSADELLSSVGERLGHSAWRLVEQDRINGFAEVTEDRQWIHVDAARAGDGPYGKPVAHGYLTLALSTVMLAEVFRVDGVGMMINKGLDRVRFHRPVPAGARIRIVADLASAKQRPRGFTEAAIDITAEIEGDKHPVFGARSLQLFHTTIDAGADNE